MFLNFKKPDWPRCPVHSPAGIRQAITHKASTNISRNNAETGIKNCDKYCCQKTSKRPKRIKKGTAVAPCEGQLFVETAYQLPAVHDNSKQQSQINF